LFIGIIAVSAQIFYYDSKLTNAAIFSPPDYYQGRVTTVFEKSIEKPFTLIVNGSELSIPQEERTNWIEEYTRMFTSKTEFRPNTEVMATYLEDLAPGINTEPINGRFVMVDGNLEEYKSAINGKRLDIVASTNAMVDAMNKNQEFAQLTVVDAEPDINLEKLQKLGITTLLGRGESNFGGSSLARVHNIEIGAEKLNGFLLTPGQEFSFNDSIGTISGATGYKYNLVIKGNTLVPEYGGGICQVSTTLFRAAL